MTVIASRRPVSSSPWGGAIGPQPARLRRQAQLDHVVASVARRPASAAIGIDTAQSVNLPRRVGVAKVRRWGLGLMDSVIAHVAVTGFGFTLAHAPDVEVRDGSPARQRKRRQGTKDERDRGVWLLAIPPRETAGPPAAQPSLREAAR